MTDRFDHNGKAAWLGTLSRLPVFFALAGRRVVIAGDGTAAAWKAELLSAAGADVNVYAAAPAQEMLRLAAEPPRGRIVIHRCGWKAGDLDGAALAVGECPDDMAAAALFDAARAAGVPVNVIDRPAFCDFSFGAIVNRSPLVIGISTDGAAPVFARAIRGRIEALLPPALARWAAFAGRIRNVLPAAGLSFAARRRFWDLFAARALADPTADPDRMDFAGALSGVGETADGDFKVIDIDCGDVEALTLRAIRALQSADVIFHDRRVPHAVLDFARREARKVSVAPGEIAGLRRRGAVASTQGRRVVVLAVAPAASQALPRDGSRRVDRDRCAVRRPSARQISPPIRRHALPPAR